MNDPGFGVVWFRYSILAQDKEESELLKSKITLCSKHCGAENCSSNNGWKMNPVGKLRLVSDRLHNQSFSFWLTCEKLVKHLLPWPYNSSSFIPLISQPCHDNFVVQTCFSLASSLFLLLHWDAQRLFLFTGSSAQLIQDVPIWHLGVLLFSSLLILILISLHVPY